MAIITASVGTKAANRKADVTAVQTLLNLRVAAYDMKSLRTDGVCDPETIRAIRNFQIRSMGLAKADGRIDPVGRTVDALAISDDMSLSRELAKAAAAKSRLSGKDWFTANQANFPNSNATSELTPGFGAMADSFIAALRTAGATVMISATRRNKTRAWLMHHCWQLAHGAEQPSAITPDPDCDIIWDHGDAKLTRAAAAEMVAAFQIAFKPSLTSNHIRGTAVDMTISWSGPINMIDAAGKVHKLDTPRSGSTNSALHAIGASYGVKKLMSDPPHWSLDGH